MNNAILYGLVGLGVISVSLGIVSVIKTRSNYDDRNKDYDILKKIVDGINTKVAIVESNGTLIDQKVSEIGNIVAEIKKKVDVSGG